MVDILIKHGLLLTMRGEGVGPIEDGALAVEDGRIIDVGKTREVKRHHGGAEWVFNAKGKAVLPGFVDAHIHTSLTLLRGEAQDVPEIEWMLRTLAPFIRYLEEEHRIAGAALGVLEALKAGTTCIGEVGSRLDEITKSVYAPSGIRACLAPLINEIGPDSRPDPYKPYILHPEIGERRLKEALEFVERWSGAEEGRITCMLAPHAADMMSRELLLRVREEAQRLRLMMHMHVAQGGREAIQIKLRYDTSTIRFLDSIGYLDSRLLAVHCHQASEEEMELLASKGVRYVSCPSSIALIDGITPPLALYLASGGEAAAIGSDQACGNNCHNMLMEMKIAALLNKTRHKDPTILPAWKVLRVATIEGAKALGLESQIGSLEEGKRADILILDLKRPHMTPILSKPVRNAAPNIVYSARGDEVETLIIDGRVVMENRRVLTMDEERVLAEAQRAAEEVVYNAAEDFMAADSHLAKAVRRGLL
jgi:5-methylthioadenosine/S-adenosylhomocysteine deaminase